MAQDNIVRFPRTLNDVKQYVVLCLKTFDNDPPDSDYQEGYYACLVDMEEYINGNDNPVSD